MHDYVHKNTEKNVCAAEMQAAVVHNLPGGARALQDAAHALGRGHALCAGPLVPKGRVCGGGQGED